MLKSLSITLAPLGKNKTQQGKAKQDKIRWDIVRSDKRRQGTIR